MTVAIRAAAVLLWVSGAGLGICCVIAIQSVAATGRIAFVAGYPTFGQGNFERHGEATSIALLVAFLLVCLVELTAGWLLWQMRLSGGLLALAVLPASAIFWWGFDLPYPPVAAAVRTVLIVVAWRALQHAR